MNREGIVTERLDRLEKMVLRCVGKYISLSIPANASLPALEYLEKHLEFQGLSATTK